MATNPTNWIRNRVTGLRNGRNYRGSTPEDAILLAAQIIEAAGAHPLLTDASSALWQAHGKLVDYIELVMLPEGKDQ